MDRSSIIRTAAILYADSNQDTKQRTIIRKIVESLFISNQNKPITIDDAINQIYINLDMKFEQIELEKIINDKKNHFEVINKQDNAYHFCLPFVRFNELIEKQKNNSIETYLQQFIENNYSGSLGKGHLTDVLYSYVYDLLNKNINIFAKIIHSKNKVNDVSIDDAIFNIEERKAINEFLNWENSEKNKSLFDLVSYAIEFALINNKAESSSLFSSNIKNKIFYLDNNVIYRAIGINGEERKNRIIEFMNKCIGSGQKFVISKYTISEFHQTIDFHIKQLKKVNFNRIAPALFTKYAINPSIYEFYHTWRLDRYVADLDTFSSHVKASFNEFVLKFDVSIEYKLPYDDQDKKVIQVVNKYKEEIGEYKKGRGSEESHVLDAKNTYLIEFNRNGNDYNITDTKFFFVSVDQRLRSWDFNRNDKQPIALLPSHWMSILLKFFSRSDDDYKSFVSFLKLRQEEPVIQGETLHVVLAGISEVTEDFEKQNLILSSMMEQGIAKIVEGHSIDDIKNGAVNFAKKTMDKDIEIMKKEYDDKNERDLNEAHKGFDAILLEREQAGLKILIEQKTASIKLLEHGVNDLERYKVALDSEVKRRVDFYKFLFSLLVIGFVIIQVYLIQKYGWDTFEKYTWFGSLFVMVIPILYFCIKAKALNPLEYYKCLNEIISKNVYDNKNFNEDRLDEINCQIKALEVEIEKLKKELNG
jgi:hypothetical protein